MARLPTPGTFAWWLRRARKARYPERQLDAIADIKRLTGVSISPSEFAQWESGSREPRADNPKRQLLYDFFGGTEADDKEAATPGVDAAALVAVVTRLAESVERIEGRLDRVSGSVDGMADGLMALLARLVSEHAENVDASAQRRAETQ